jgi:ParB-like chromosome segregation protein Spo0J
MKYDTDFQRLIPPLSKEEYDLLRKSIRKEGCRDAIVVWTEMLTDGTEGRTMILDGHNRYEICTKNKIPFETKVIGPKELKDMKEARIWVIQNQLGRRNLTDYQRGKLTLELKTRIQGKAKKKQTESGGAVVQKSAEPPIKTREELAKIAGISHDTLHKIEVIEKEAPPEIKQQANKGEISIHRAYVMTKTPTDIEPKDTPVRKESKNLSQLKICYIKASIGDKKKFRRWLRTQRN